MKDLNLGQKIR